MINLSVSYEAGHYFFFMVEFLLSPEQVALFYR